MFTGLIRGIGKVTAATPKGRGRTLMIDISSLDGAGIEIGASIAVSGACLTVTALAGNTACFDAVEESVGRTTLAELRPGDHVNLEPALRLGDPLDGHLVLGHVDAVGRVLEVRFMDMSRIFRFSLPEAIRSLVAAKGSIAVDGISLTVVDAGHDWFAVSVIPHTADMTTLGLMRVDSRVNLEADVIARYTARQLSMSGSGLSEDFLRENGF